MASHLDHLSQDERDDLARTVRATPKPEGETTIDKVRNIVKSHTASRVGGLYVDAFTAQMVIQVYDQLKPENQAKFAELPIRKMVARTFKILDKVKK